MGSPAATLALVADRDEIIAFLDDLLEASAFEDYGPNGLQVPGSATVHAVATGVSANLELFERAAAHGAELVLCHHGIFWDGDTRVITPQRKERLTLLFEHDMSLAAYHLPLDAHPEVGNNALICEALGLERGHGFGEHRGRMIGVVGHSREGIAFDELRGRCASVFGSEPFVWDSGPDVVHRVGIVSGGAASDLGAAISLGLDAFITGEPAEPAMADAREAGIHFVAAGHYASETFGVRRLGELVAERFGVRHDFVEVPNPV